MKNDIKIAKKRDFSNMSQANILYQDTLNNKLKLGSGTTKKFSHLSNNSPFSIHKSNHNNTNKLDSLNEADEDQISDEENNDSQPKSRSSKHQTGHNDDDVIEEEIEEDADIDKESKSKLEKA